MKTNVINNTLRNYLEKENEEVMDVTVKAYYLAYQKEYVTLTTMTTHEIANRLQSFNSWSYNIFLAFAKEKGDINMLRKLKKAAQINKVIAKVPDGIVTCENSCIEDANIIVLGTEKNQIKR